MAKNPFWLRNARGKFAGAVIQRGESGTIIRENVTPKNPRTPSQMAQRVLFGTLSTAAYWLQKIVGQTFEQTENATLNKRAFMSANTPLLRSIALQDMEGQRVFEGSFDPKGSRILVPNRYIVSKGSLPLPAQLRFSLADDGIELLGGSKTATLVTGTTYTAAELWEMTVGITPGQQLTWVQIETMNDESGVAFDTGADVGYDEGYTIQRYGEFSSARLVLLEGTGSSITIAAGTALNDILACMETLVDLGKTSGAMWSVTGHISFVTCFTLADGSLTFTPAPLIADFELEDWTTQAVGIIVSQYFDNRWHYSTTKLACKKPQYNQVDVEPFDNNNFGLNIWEAISTYMPSQQSKSSDLYTRQGGDDNSINF